MVGESAVSVDSQADNNLDGVEMARNVYLLIGHYSAGCVKAAFGAHARSC